MKRALSLLFVVVPVLPFVGCSSEDVGPEYPSGGTGTTAGSPATGGSTSGSGTGGAEAGTSTTGGMTTGGMATGGSAGSGTGGAMGGTGGSAGSGTGGAMGGTGGGGAGGGAGGSGETPVSVGKLDGMLVQTPCKNSSTDDCDSAGWIYEGKTYACSGGNLDTDNAMTRTILDFPVTGGTPGKVYMATMRFLGIMEPKNYGDAVQREATNRPGLNSPSDPPPFAWGKTPNPNVRASDYNTYEMHIIDDKGMVVKKYYLNADTQEGHYTFVIDYERQIEIIAGGKVHIRSFDANCRMIKNCGTTGAGQPCGGKAQSVASVAQAMPAISVMQPGLGNAADQAGQWFAIDVKSIVPKP
jgi:hypothetical protein